MTNKDYEQLNKKASPPSKSYINIPYAFLIGGIICTFGEFLSNTYQGMGMDQDTAGAVVSGDLGLSVRPADRVKSMIKSPNTAAQEPWSPSPALPTLWSPRRWSSKARG